MSTSTESATPRKKSNVNAMRLFERYALILVWFLLIAGFSIAMPESFLRWGNFSILFASYAPAALLALAIIIPLTSGDYDLAVGATMTLSSCMIAVLNSWMDVSIELSILLALLGGLAVGLFHALFIVYFRIHSLVVTLGSTSLISGVVQWFTNSSTIGGIDNALIMWVVGGRLFGVPYAFYYAFAAAIVLWYVFDFTPLGRRLLFVGRGREVARLNGIPVEKMRVGALVASSVVAALAGVLYAGVLGSADPYSGLNYLLPAFAAAFLGSTTIMPGRFNPWGTIVAVYFLGTGITGLTMFGIPLWVTNVFNGGALILAVTISQLTRGREASDIG
ncbi:MULTISPECIES: ABC transporter permease [Maritimibacter]|uniref:Ribose ABC transporter, permease protein n=1 Tax=Maritimibacter alkaliphilus HTCC2654 TaxID=314271 RepID=A3VGA5_9RHOB|nr:MULTISPECIES: ABC transporter permease [Maritimibacter]EAQ12881.1 ribose ABC transporter, permease protein [Rhodobacterales bacterium HTCC2654] [Maritimibacter alkaliphilus HTCC2654]TYP85726.1 monosaccharide ABC transporter membrane protein (CUT2 family) [Maritimibacter alkaliphilus HTCC2654]